MDWLFSTKPWFALLSVSVGREISWCFHPGYSYKILYAPRIAKINMLGTASKYETFDPSMLYMRGLPSACEDVFFHEIFMGF